jgi:lysophospholipase L1-like esterase
MRKFKALVMAAALFLALLPAEAPGKETIMRIFLGDSLTAGHDWARVFPPAVNLGIGGDTCAGVWARSDEVVDLKPTEIFLQIGINDFLRGASPGEILEGHLRIWDELAARLPDTRLRVISLLPYLEAALPGLPPNLEIIHINTALAEEADRRELVFIDLFRDLADEDKQLRLDFTSDGVHLTPLAYKVWAERLRAFIMESGGPL